MRFAAAAPAEMRKKMKHCVGCWWVQEVSPVARSTNLISHCLLVPCEGQFALQQRLTRISVVRVSVSSQPNSSVFEVPNFSLSSFEASLPTHLGRVGRSQGHRWSEWILSSLSVLSNFVVRYSTFCDLSMRKNGHSWQIRRRRRRRDSAMRSFVLRSICPPCVSVTS